MSHRNSYSNFILLTQYQNLIPINLVADDRINSKRNSEPQRIIFLSSLLADIKKHAQELYALINYGEMRKKLVFVNAKACMKLKELVYHGSVSIRVKGKNIRIKTPSCKALRQLNQMEGKNRIESKMKNFQTNFLADLHTEWQEEIKLPSKVDVYLKPANVDSWGRVQTLAQNPRVKTILPLQKRVLSLLKTFEVRWRSRDIRLVCFIRRFSLKPQYSY